MDKNTYEEMNEQFLQTIQYLTGMSREDIEDIPAEELNEIMEDYQIDGGDHG
jgi:hypothetical protein